VELLSQTIASSVRPDVSLDGAGRSHVGWQEGESNGVGQVYLVRRDPAGLMNQWDVPVFDWSGHPRVGALADGQVDVVWYRRLTSVDQAVYYRRYQLDGTYDCQQRYIGTTPDFQKDPVVALSGTGTATLLWLDLGMFFDEQLWQGSVDYLCDSDSDVVSNPGNDHPRPTIDIAGARTERLLEFGNQIRRLTPTNGTCQISSSPTGACCASVGTTADTSYAVWQEDLSRVPWKKEMA
jgi:hypothetical protein